MKTVLLTLCLCVCLAASVPQGGTQGGIQQGGTASLLQNIFSNLGGSICPLCKFCKFASTCGPNCSHNYCNFCKYKIHCDTTCQSCGNRAPVRNQPINRPPNNPSRGLFGTLRRFFQ